MNNSKLHDFDSQWGNQLISQLLDSEFQPSPLLIKQNGWSALVVADILNWMEAEWLAEAISSINQVDVIGIGFEYQAAPEITALTPTMDKIIEYNNSNSWRHAIISSPDVKYLYYKDYANRFYLLCGPSHFVIQSYKCSRETAKKMYFDYWVDLEQNTENEKMFLKTVWHKYCNF